VADATCTGGRNHADLAGQASRFRRGVRLMCAEQVRFAVFEPASDPGSPDRYFLFT
jgi:hypothetical protein